MLGSTSARWSGGAAITAVLLACSGCGSNGASKATTTAARQAIAVRVLSPADGSRVRRDRVAVRGTVTPSDATVQVIGHDAQVGDGVFTASVELHAGANAIDVVASGHGAAPASSTVTVTRVTTRKSAPAITKPVQPAAPAPSSSSPAEPVAPAPAPAGSASGDWPGGAGYTAVLASLSSEAAARGQQARATAAGLDAGVLFSSRFRSLRPGYWVVFSGVFGAQADAARRAAHAKELGYAQAYPRYVAP